MGFWDLKTLRLDEFRPGIRSKLESGTNLTMAFMEIAPNKEGNAHDLGSLYGRSVIRANWLIILLC